ncbi:E3 ubiquitin-protein ligase Topors-like [Eptesicus fuscus]|uniref:E3 ubiquitin-protein ligase Topors-like n=1 Tax=Eptesicus fuscus TaxID=29078 RepID=UPI002403B846|nr:E3 ubiquitin-protein ligase Topors-like [Eptesicus fuscus]
MASFFSSDCECSNCLDSAHNDSDCNPCFNKSDDSDSLGSRSRTKSKASGMKCFPSACCPTRSENDNRKETAFPSSEEERCAEASQDNHFSMNPEGIKKKIRQIRELTVEELVKEFGDNWKFQPNAMSLGHFRDQVVMKFRRALYYSGIWVAHVQGYRLEKHFSANYFKRNPGGLQRLVPWLKRELTAVYGDYGYTVKNILSTILRHMTEYDLDSESFIHLLEPYLQQHTHHFLHEFISFVNSPYNMETYDQRAIYQCSASPWAQKKFAPVLPLPQDEALLASQHDTRPSRNTSGPWNSEQMPLSGLKQFPNGNPFLEGSEIPPVHHKTACKIHAWIRDEPESGDHNGTISTNDMLLNWAIPGERGPVLQNCKQNVQERKMKGIKVLPYHVQGLGEGEIATDTFSPPAVFNQGKQWKHSLRGRKALRPGQHMDDQKKEAEKNKYSDSSPKIFQRRLPRERSLSCKSRKRDPSWSCISENARSSERYARKLSSSRKKRMKCRQCSQFAEVGSHSSRRLQRQSRSSTRRSKSWCVTLTKRSVSRESRRHSRRGSYRSERFPHNIGCEPSKDKHGYESNHLRAYSTTAPYMNLPPAAGRKPKCSSKSEGASQAGSHCNSPSCLQIEKHRSPSKQEMKQKPTFPRGSKTRTVRKKNNKCEYPDMQTTEEVSDEVADLNALRQVSHLSEGVPSCRRQIQKKKSRNLQKHHQAENEQGGDTVSETQRGK